MTGLKYYERTKLLIKLIEAKQTGTPRELARKFGVSQRMVYHILDDLRLSTEKKLSSPKKKEVICFLKKIDTVKDYFTEEGLNSAIINLIIDFKTIRL